MAMGPASTIWYETFSARFLGFISHPLPPQRISFSGHRATFQGTKKRMEAGEKCKCTPGRATLSGEASLSFYQSRNSNPLYSPPLFLSFLPDPYSPPTPCTPRTSSWPTCEGASSRPWSRGNTPSRGVEPSGREGGRVGIG